MSKKDVRHHLDRTASLIDSLAANLAPEPSGHEVALLATYLSDLYLSIEEVMKAIADSVGVAVPGGPQSHADLLKMSEIPARRGSPS